MLLTAPLGNSLLFFSRLPLPAFLPLNPLCLRNAALVAGASSCSLCKPAVSVTFQLLTCCQVFPFPPARRTGFSPSSTLLSSLWSSAFHVPLPFLQGAILSNLRAHRHDLLVLPLKFTQAYDILSPSDLFTQGSYLGVFPLFCSATRSVVSLTFLMLSGDLSLFWA